MKTLIIVDDEVSIRKGLIDTINWNDFGYQVIGEASNGKDAIELVKTNKPDIVLTDIVMPELNGIDLTKYLSKFYPEIAILVLSNYSDFDYVKEALLTGAQDYLLKATISENKIMESLNKIKIHKIQKTLPLTLKELIHKALTHELIEKEHQQLTEQLNYPKSYLIVSDLFNTNLQSQLEFTDFIKINLKDTALFSYQIQTHQIYLLNTCYTQQQLLTLFNQKNSNLIFFGCLSDPLLTFKNLKNKIQVLSLKLNLRFNSKNKRLVLADQIFTFQDLPFFQWSSFRPLFLNSMND